ncbi:hypothetical protein V8E36_003111 [Tilletia maclaganii]
MALIFLLELAELLAVCMLCAPTLASEQSVFALSNQDGAPPELPSTAHWSVGTKKAASTGTVNLSTEWTAIGPVPAGMREQHLGANPLAVFGHPAILLDRSRANSTWLPPFTAYGTFSPRANFTSTLMFSPAEKARQRHSLKLEIPIDAEGIRGYQGWAALQWQAYVSSSLTIECEHGANDCLVDFAILRAAEWTVVPEDTPTESLDQLEWYVGDWYNYNDAPPPFEQQHITDTHSSRKPAPSSPQRLRLRTGRHVLLLRAIYEDRIFGDPRDYSSAPQAPPSLTLEVDVALSGADQESLKATRILAPSIVNGVVAGWGFAVDLLNRGLAAATIGDVEAELDGHRSGSLSAKIPIAVRIEPGQIRPIQVQIEQRRGLLIHEEAEAEIPVRLTLRGHDSNKAKISLQVNFTFGIVDLEKKNSDGTPPGSFVFTFMALDGSLSISAAIAPNELTRLDPSHEASQTRTFLVLHGAGVNALDPGWARSLPRQRREWIVLPTGATEWGYDWQLTSGQLALAAVDALSKGAATLAGNGAVASAHLWDARVPLLPGATRKFSPNRLIVMGHSNGGQGAWHQMTKHPNDVLGGVVAASYIKLSDYVDFNWHVGRQYVDPALSGILRTSLASFENDLFANNLAGIPLLVKFGEEDTNVPTWHSRSMSALVAGWNRYSIANESIAQGLLNISAVPGRPHWWDETFLEDDVNTFLKDSPDRVPHSSLRKMQLTVTDPSESGPMGMWRITRVEIPGRLARLIVSQPIPNFFLVDAVNVGTISLTTADILKSARGQGEAELQMSIQGTRLSLNVMAERARAGNRTEIFIKRSGGDKWTEVIDMDPDRWSRPMGPLIRALTSLGPLQLVLPTNCSNQVCGRYRSVAQRFAHDIFLYGRIDARLLLDSDVIDTAAADSPSAGSAARHLIPGSLDSSTVVMFGGPDENLLAAHMASEQPLPVYIDGKLVRARSSDDAFFASPCLAFTTLGPHPLRSSTRSLSMTVWGNDLCGIETAARVLPVRTGAQVPEWIVIDGGTSAWQGAGGVLAAGWYSADWGFSASMSFLS